MYVYEYPYTYDATVGSFEPFPPPTVHVLVALIFYSDEYSTLVRFACAGESEMFGGRWHQNAIAVGHVFVVGRSSPRDEPMRSLAYEYSYGVGKAKWEIPHFDFSHPGWTMDHVDIRMARHGTSTRTSPGLVLVRVLVPYEYTYSSTLYPPATTRPTPVINDGR